MSDLVFPRRSFLTGLVSLIAAPAVVRAEALMPIVVWRPSFWLCHGAISKATLFTCDKDDFFGASPESLGLPPPYDWDSGDDESSLSYDWGLNPAYQWYWSCPRDIERIPRWLRLELGLPHDR
jgi:hypothetical protein